MENIDLFEADDGTVVAFEQLKGKALLREIEPTSQFTLLSAVPQWVRDLGFVEKYDARMSMSTVCYMYSNPHFNSAAIWSMMSRWKDIPLVGGTIINVSSADATTDPTEGAPVKIGPRKGRNPINPRVPPRRAHGQYKSFGTSIEMKLRVDLEKGPDFNPSMREREFKVKLFATNIQIPGCGNEDMYDVSRVIALIDQIFAIAYKQVVSPPVDFARFQRLLEFAGENPLKYPKPEHYNDIVRGKTHIYSRNYTIHYKPLVEDINEIGQNRHAINLEKLTNYLLANPELTRGWEEQCGLSGVRLTYTMSSDSSNRRAQFIFHTPQFSHDGEKRTSEVTKAFVESSGKINIELSNNYYWRDTLWRIFAYLSFIVGNYCIEPRVSSVISKASAPAIRSMYTAVNARLTDRDIYSFLAEISSDVSSEEEELYDF